MYTFKMTEIFAYSWNQMATAYWHRYPNPFNGNVLSEDIIERSIDKHGKLVSKRLLCKKWSMPWWTSKFIKSKSCFVIEESVMDPSRKTFTTRAKNLGFQKMITIIEEVTYQQCKDDNSMTVAERRAFVKPKVSFIFGSIQSIVEKYFQEGWLKSSKGYRAVLSRMFPNGSSES